MAGVGRQLDPTGVLALRQVPSAPWACLRVGVWTALPYITPFPLEVLGRGVGSPEVGGAWPSC